MEEEKVFAQTLKRLCEQAARQDNMVDEKQLETAFEKAGIFLGNEQLSLVREYLKSKKIGVGKPPEPVDNLSEEETDFLEMYLKGLADFENVSEQEKEAVLLSAMTKDEDACKRLTEIFLPKVPQIAQLYAGQGVFLEDLIGEGNLALTMAVGMLDTVADTKEASGMIVGMMMEAMETYIAENVQERKTGCRLAETANEILGRAKALAKELGRSATVEEFCDETGIAPKTVREAMKFTADQIEGIVPET